jgi:plasmid stabilization system protein ParE
MAAQYRVDLTAKAKSDIQQAKAWLTQPGSGRRAWALYARINRAILDLRESHHRWPGGEHDAVRERAVEGYRILYRCDDALRTVEVLRVFGPFQNRTSL